MHEAFKLLILYVGLLGSSSAERRHFKVASMQGFGPTMSMATFSTSPRLNQISIDANLLRGRREEPTNDGDGAEAEKRTEKGSSEESLFKSLKWPEFNKGTAIYLGLGLLGAVVVITCCWILFCGKRKVV